MNLDNISGMINAIPLILVYIVPGYIILKISHFQLSKKADKDQYILVKSLVISFVFVSAGEAMWGYLFPDAQAMCSIVFRNTMIISSAVVGLLWSRFLTSTLFERILYSLGIHKTLRSGIWSDVVDFEYGLWLMVYIPADKVVYAGKLRRYSEIETHGNYTVFLSNYTLYDYNAETLKDYVEDNDKWVALNSKDIGRVELFYHPNSGKISH
ncbi:MAG: hypothetical protein ACOX42_08880 [Clostridia bacterium]|jgi:protein-S-isoprenylcysteine O-methyltransferase Ste14